MVEVRSGMKKPAEAGPGVRLDLGAFRATNWAHGCRNGLRVTLANGEMKVHALSKRRTT